MTLSRSFCLLPAAAVLAACAAREVTPVAMAQPGDEQLSCAGLNSQLAANTQDINTLLKQDKAVERSNIVAGVLPLPMLMDLSNEEQVKARALLDRNERLGYLVKTKGCTAP